jgi:predicted component of type VI protein secretion system
VPTDTFRHVVMFLHESFALPLRRISLMVTRITSLRLRGVREILLLIMLHMVDKITMRILNYLLLLNAHSNELFNSLVFRLGVVVNLKGLKFLGQGRHD